MFRKLSPALLFLATIAVVAAAPMKEKKAQTIKGWGTVIDPDRDCKVTEEEGKVTITVPKTNHDLTYNGTKRNAPRILQDVKGDFRVQVKVRVFALPQANTSSSGRLSFVSSGLLVWIDDKSFLRLERAGEGSVRLPFIWAERFQDGKLISQNGPQLSGDDDIWLRMIRENGNLTLSCSGDGKLWTDVLAEELRLPEEVKVGVLAINTTTQEFAPTLEKFKLEKK